MNRKEFIKAGIVGSALLTSGELLPKSSEEINLNTEVGYNHLPKPKSKIMENTVLHKANTRGHANYGWLNTHHTFSFSTYHNPERMHFGVLRVLNDDEVIGGAGFGTHPHSNMEIITIPLLGALEHKDSMGNTSVINRGDIQAMSAGTGITHSEYNKNEDKDLKFLQIWVFPNKKNVTPRYDQISLNPADRKNQLQQILSPNQTDDGIWIHQDAWFHLGILDQGKKVSYPLKNTANGVYAFVLSGSFKINEHEIEERDGLGIWDIEKLEIEASESNAEILLMEVPMKIS